MIGLIAIHINKMLAPPMLTDMSFRLNLLTGNKFHQLLDIPSVNEVHADILVLSDDVKQYQVTSDQQFFQLLIKTTTLWRDFEYRYLFIATFFWLLFTILSTIQVNLFIKQNERLFHQKDEMEALNGKLRLARYRAEESNRLKSEFLSNVSHELRTPLHSVIGFCELGESYISEWSHDERIENLMEINDSGQQLLGFINNFLDLSALEVGRFELKLSQLT